jgi:protein-S-isoprenylcysteine O-methyltransferase Ste14
MLLLGLVFHKLLWEYLKRTETRPQPVRRPSGSAVLHVVKLGKIAALGFLLVQTLWLDVVPISRRPRSVRVIGLILYVLGLATAVAGRVQLGKDWANLEDSRVMQGQALVTDGIYRYVRHPIYTGDLLLLAGLELALNSWLVLVVAIPLVVVARQVGKEEELLGRAFPDYGDYRQRTKRFIPLVV